LVDFPPLPPFTEFKKKKAEFLVVDFFRFEMSGKSDQDAQCTCQIQLLSVLSGAIGTGRNVEIIATSM
jgi:hypothetical protein